MKQWKITEHVVSGRWLLLEELLVWEHVVITNTADGLDAILHKKEHLKIAA